MQEAHHPRQNRLLEALPAASFDTLSMDLQLVPMLLGDMLYEPGKPLTHAYFPTTAVVSLHYVTLSGASAETSAVGHEGVFGIPLFMGGGTTTGSAVVLAGGHGYRLERRALIREFDRAGPLRSALLRYTQAMITQLVQTAACYCHHTVEQQLSRWLLSAADRVSIGSELVMTQELVAGLLGVRRESITQAAGRLQELGYIRYRRGHISVLDHVGLQTCACECYGVVREEVRRLLAMHQPACIA
jgi:CRP-like cAMP-binding protein